MNLYCAREVELPDKHLPPKRIARKYESSIHHATFSRPNVADFCLSGVLLRPKKFQRFLRCFSVFMEEFVVFVLLVVLSKMLLCMDEVLLDKFMAENCWAMESLCGKVFLAVAAGDGCITSTAARELVFFKPLCCRGGGVIFIGCSLPNVGAADAARIARCGGVGSNNCISVLAARSVRI
uniref:Uncharacterized protein n=1 Tax=Glossina brevipalpis TaxID=37001 RepID=A0A1A9W2W1_9MUSC